jgi:predicted nucleotidyltransferase
VSPIDLTGKIPEIRRLADAHGIARLRVFGSRARRGGTRTSDLDLLVDLAPDRDLLDLAAFKLDMEELLGCQVDVVTEAGLSLYLRDRILAEARPL